MVQKMMQKKKMLIVDDKSVNRYILKEIFEDDYEVEECTDGAEAIHALTECGEEMAAVLLDIVMPTCDGFSVLEYMKEQKLQNVPVVLVSANVNDENIRKAYAYQVADYIQKPFQEEVVKRRVEQVIKMFEKRRDMKKETAK